MIPEVVQKQLNRFKGRDRLLRATWGMLVVLTIGLCVFVLTGLTDWIIDLYQDTPRNLLLGFLITQGCIFLIGFIYFVIRPLRQELTDSEMAVTVEKMEPIFNHRLITTIELNQPDAKTSGASKNLLGSITKEVALISSRINFADAIDPVKMRRCLKLGGGLLAVVALLVLLFPFTLRALVARQLLMDRPIPRSVHLNPTSAKIWPSGEPIELVFDVTGTGWDKEDAGTVSLRLKDGSAVDFPLTWKKTIAENKAQFIAKIPASSMSFHYRAWLGDGRTRHDGEVRFEARPSLVHLTASEILPKDCGVRPDGSPYEELQEKGDIVAFRGSWGRVGIQTNKRIATATLELMTAQNTDADEMLSRTVPMKLNKDRKSADVVFELLDYEHAYRVILIDAHGLRNRHLPRRNISFRPNDPPQVKLLPERFPGEGTVSYLEDAEMDGIPAISGRPIRIAFQAKTNRALDRAALRYRVLMADEEATQFRPAWNVLPLREVKQGNADVGSFVLERGVFEKTDFLDEVEFHVIPSPAPEMMRGRLEGGGRFDLKTKAIPLLQPGTRIEYYVEVYDRRKDSQPGVSEVRVKDVVAPLELTRWLRQKRDETQRLADLQKEQQGLYDPTQKIAPK